MEQKFINKSKQKYGENTFDYSKVNYTGANSEVILKCNIHDLTFNITPSKHNSNVFNGCIRCKKPRYTNLEKYCDRFITKSKQQYGENTFDYSKINYTGENGNLLFHDKLSVVNHLDENRQNNSSSNLEWCTNMENITHSCGKKVNKIDPKMSILPPVLLHTLSAIHPERRKELSRIRRK